MLLLLLPYGAFGIFVTKFASGSKVDRGKRAAAVEYKISEKMKTDVQPRAEVVGRGDNPETGEQSLSNAKNRLEWRSAIKIGDFGFSVFGASLNRCDSIYLILFGR